MTQYPIPDEAERRLPAARSMSGRLWRYLLSRYPVWTAFDHLAQKEVPRHRHTFWYGMGGVTLFFLAVQIITGVLLMVYYRPGQPWSSVQRIVMEVPFGNMIRSIHHWSANLMVFSLFLHLFSAMFMKAYRRPREFTWVSGLVLLFLTQALGFSGYLLPWDGLSFFATRVGISEMSKAPWIGMWLAGLARGGDDVTIDTIGRFYVLHVAVLPVLMLTVVGLHLLFIQIQGLSEPNSFVVLPPEKKKYHKFFSEFLFAEIPIWLFLGGLLVALATILPRALSPEADPTVAAPTGIKPEWYFLSQFQLLKLFPGRLELVGIGILVALPLIALLLPFVDRQIPSRVWGHFVTFAGVIALGGLIVFTVWSLLP